MFIQAVLIGLLFLAPAQSSKEEREKQKELKKQEEEAAKAHIDEFKAQLKECKMEGDLISAISFLGSKQHDRIKKTLLGMLGHQIPGARAEAARQLAQYIGDLAVGDMLLRGAKRDKDPGAQVAMLTALGDVKTRQFAGGLTDFFRERNVEVAKAAIDACGKLKSRLTIEDLIKYLKYLDELGKGGGEKGGVKMPKGAGKSGGGSNEDSERKKKLHPAAQEALQAITGQRLTTGKSWDDWWKKNKRTWREPELKMEPDKPAEEKDGKKKKK